MAAIIEFPKEVSIWRKNRPSSRAGSGELDGKVLLFTGVRYAKHRIMDNSADCSRAKGSKDIKHR